MFGIRLAFTGISTTGQSIYSFAQPASSEMHPFTIYLKMDGMKYGKSIIKALPDVRMPCFPACLKKG